MPQANDRNTIVPSGEATAPNVIYLAERMKERLAKNEPAMRNAVPGFDLEGIRRSDWLSDELFRLKEYLGFVAVKMTEKVKNGYSIDDDVRVAAFLMRCYHKAEWAEKRAIKLERKLDKWKARAKGKA